ncbi:MAG: OadG family protein [Bacteroidales bacterium]|nr:OadG family protein [Bacteroidales bacterium]
MRKKLLIISILLSLALGAGAQNVSDLVITEAEVDNLSGISDGFGRHSGWIEITNNSQGTVNIGGCYLTDDPDNLKKFMVSKSDLSTKIGARQTKLFYFNGPGFVGTFDVDFVLAKGSTIYLVSNDGKTIIDQMCIPADLPADMAVRKMARDSKHMDFRTEDAPAIPSPGVMNSDGDEESGAQRMAHEDPFGGVLTLTSVSVVFGALLILLCIFTITGGFFSGRFRNPFKRSPKAPKAGKAADAEVAAAIAMALDRELGGDNEVAAAIGMALDRYFNDTVHDAESFVITIKRDGNSLWNDKSKNFRQLPR